jgi:hypothetical protein
MSGLVLGCRLTVEGTPWLDGDFLVIVNPLCTFVDDDGHSACKDVMAAPMNSRVDVQNLEER